MLELLLQLPVGPLLCVITGATRGPHWSSAAARAIPTDCAHSRRTTALRTPPAPARASVELAREGVPLIVIQRQLGHSDLGITSVYPQGIDNAEIIETVHARRQRMIPVSTSRAH